MFAASGPDQVWLRDVMEHSTAEGRIDSRTKASLTVSALRNAISRREPVGAVIHSDRGPQFRSRKFVAEIKAAGVKGSRGEVDAWGDNAAMESFFALLLKNVRGRQCWKTPQDLRLAIVTWIEGTYHHRHRHRHRHQRSP
ncbi:DDE-type integrase/transposase/recombinase [Rathayibacter tanaceti]|uniref:DDE-type integrase/transposase/recombinase n=2 Tax=Rathayibacter tanaceti TaxID=1671680 RepID=A0A162GIL8_9MICO|nr:DDE-type integrase/transposase/recombinase [Rathayibacter tanaceti]KZX21789.1 Integrase core domain protein [Rathayibacter tanaceti]QHC54501.1 DDE-type integrase/transposase/recombinase [Rathayibacter tanaceti]TCO35003.1 integrase-like protein [Rathayibacter tanaceti]